jgi:hypothetical protein
MCPACWAMMAMATAGAASTGALSVLGVKMARATGARKEAGLQKQINSQINPEKWRGDEQHFD